MDDQIFREYDIRGKVGSQLQIEQVYDLTHAIVSYFKDHHPHFKSIAVGMDGRHHSEAIKQEVCRALLDAGIDVTFVGLCPSPVLYFALHTLPVDGGIMITASHNGPEYNGMKICLGTQVVWGTKLQDIKARYKNKQNCRAPAHGTYSDTPLIPAYISWLKEHFPQLYKMDLPAIIDCGNGAGGTVVPDLIKAFEWPNVRTLYAQVDGSFPNHEADPTVERNMAELKKVVQQENAIGIGLDGDCDRMVPMTRQGDLISGDKLLSLFAKEVLEQHSGAGIVFDLKSSSGLSELITAWGGKPIMSASGHSIIKDMMIEHGALLGGELSCHFFFKDSYFGYDDGIYAMLRVFSLLLKTGKGLAELVSIFPKKYTSRELRLPVADDQKKAIVHSVKEAVQKEPDVLISTIDGVRAEHSFGWTIIRPSNTQPALSMRFESDTQAGLKRIMAYYLTLLTPYLDQESMREYREEMERACG